jgi:hypothetical protein
MKLNKDRRTIDWSMIRKTYPLSSEQLIFYFSETKNPDLFDHSMPIILEDDGIYLMYVGRAVQRIRRLYEFFDRYSVFVSVMFDDRLPKPDAGNGKQWYKTKKKLATQIQKFEVKFRFRINSPICIYVGSEYKSRKMAEAMAFYKAFETLEMWLRTNNEMSL